MHLASHAKLCPTMAQEWIDGYRCFGRIYDVKIKTQKNKVKTTRSMPTVRVGTPFRRFFCLASVLGSLISAQSAADAALAFVNGSFEATPGFGEFPTGWTASNLQGFGVLDWAAVVNPAFPAPDGNNGYVLSATDTGGNDFLSQTVSGFTVGDTYTLTFAIAPEAGPSAGRPGAFMDIFFTGANISVANFSAIGIDGQFWGPWQAQSVSFTATSTSVDFLMKANLTHPGGSWEMGLDNFQLTAVPEPSTYVAGALLLLPFVLQTVRHLRNRKSAA